MLIEWSRPRPIYRHDKKAVHVKEVTFVTSTRPALASIQQQQPPSKRLREQADVDGEGSENTQKKKRRLRLDLITSRLSRPYATPATHIIGRGVSKIATWARRKALGRVSLRKAASLNWIRMKKASTEDAKKRQLRPAENTPLHDESYETLSASAADNRQRQSSPPPRSIAHQEHLPPFPSPLGASYYDAFDEEGDPFDEDQDTAENETVYSDFNRLETMDLDEDNYDSLAPFESNPVEDLRPPTPGREIVDLIMENERQEEGSFVHLRS
ncbi:hypothetical protein MMC12_007279 [Toensbergia leucococca]|nr:hypothetical protein [Toensbergia leucococca]